MPHFGHLSFCKIQLSCKGVERISLSHLHFAKMPCPTLSDTKTTAGKSRPIPDFIPHHNKEKSHRQDNNNLPIRTTDTPRGHGGCHALSVPSSFTGESFTQFFSKNCGCKGRALDRQAHPQVGVTFQDTPQRRGQAPQWRCPSRQAPFPMRKGQTPLQTAKGKCPNQFFSMDSPPFDYSAERLAMVI